MGFHLLDGGLLLPWQEDHLVVRKLNETDQKRLERFLEDAREKASTYLGYPAARDLDASLLSDCLNLPLNNIGDPFAKGTWKVDSREFEREVLSFFADLLRAPGDNWWGYITNGGTEGNLYGLYLARELYPNGMVYLSQDSHYSVMKNVHFLNMRHIMIRSQPNGEIDYEDLRETINLHRDAPPIIFANIGTTMTEAKDDIAQVQTMIADLVIPNFYIHCDAAMSGAIAPFLDKPPPFDFADGAHSIAISGHKFLGSAIPCGIVMALKSNVDRIARNIAYIGNLDTTITGSRNGLTPLILWQVIWSLGREGIADRVAEAMSLTDYAFDQMTRLCIDVCRNPNAITLYFPVPQREVVERWQLATNKGMSHIILVPGTSKDLLNRFIKDLADGSRR